MFQIGLAEVDQPGGFKRNGPFQPQIAYCKLFCEGRSGPCIKYECDRHEVWDNNITGCIGGDKFKSGVNTESNKDYPAAETQLLSNWKLQHKLIGMCMYFANHVIQFMIHSKKINFSLKYFIS